MSEKTTDNDIKQSQCDLEKKPEPFETWDDSYERQKANAKRVREALLGGPDEVSWAMPCEDIVGVDVLAEHFQQIRNAVRYTLHQAFADRQDAAVSLSAAATAGRLIQTNIALAKALGVVSNSKTVRGMARKGGPQD